MPIVLLLCLLLVGPFISVAGTTPLAGGWEQWDGCTLVPDHYFDGDSFPVTHENRLFVLRLYSVDAPETATSYEARLREQSAYFGVTNEQTLRAGAEAKEFTARFLAKPFRVITRLKTAPGASRIERRYAIVERDGQRLDGALVQAGLARVTGEIPEFPDAEAGAQRESELRSLEQRAAQDRKGLWAQSQRTDRRAPWLETVKRRLKPGGSLPTPHKVKLNSATRSDLESLPGIGPKTAEEMIRARPLHSFEELDQVHGIGPKKIAALRDLVSFE
ncbi:MAG: competence protein ComEA [Chthoniobacter sp.]|nr:competence protein ComEA [Chthoniobacter sp.]